MACFTVSQSSALMQCNRNNLAGHPFMLTRQACEILTTDGNSHEPTGDAIIWQLPQAMWEEMTADSTCSVPCMWYHTTIPYNHSILNGGYQSILTGTIQTLPIYSVNRAVQDNLKIHILLFMLCESNTEENATLSSNSISNSYYF
jgi:hypothetical protein